MIRRTSLLLLELVGGLLAGLVILAAVAIWRLSSGPISLGFLTPYIEKAVSVEERSIAVRIQDTVLVWAGWDRAVDIRANNVTILGSGGKILATLPEVSLGLSLHAMMFGTAAPTSLDILGLSATVERAEDGRIVMGFIAGKDSPADETFVRELPAIFADLMGPPDSGGAFSYLRRVSLLNTDLRFEDRLKDAMWHAPNADVVFVRGEAGFEVDAVLDLDFEGRESRVSGHLVFAQQRPTMAATFHFADLRPSDVASRLESGEILTRLDLPLSGSIDAKIRKDGALEALAFEIEGTAGSVAGDVVIPSDRGDITVSARLVDLKIVDFARVLPDLTALLMLDVPIAGGVVGKFTRDGEVRAFNFDLTGGKGWLDLKDKLPAPIEVAGLRLKGAVEDGLFHASLDEAFIDFGGPSLSVDASAYRLGENYRVRLDATLNELPMGDLKSYWPTGLGVTARNWTTTNIRKGIVHEGHLNMVMRLPVDRPGGFSVESISGTMKYDGLEVGYLADLPKVAKVAGTATFGRDRFDLDVTGGRLRDVSIDHGLVNMTKLDTDNERIVIDLVLRGPLRTALEVLDHDPLKFISELGFDPKGVGGDLTMRLGFRFPLRADVKRDQINAAVSSNLRGITLDPGPFDLKLHDGDLSLKIANRIMKVEGSVLLNGVPATLDWHEDFNAKTAFRSRYLLSARPDDQGRAALGLPALSFLSGPTRTSVIFTKFDDGRRELLTGLDLAEAVISVPQLAWLKPAGVAGSANLMASFDRDGHPRVDRFEVKAGDLKAHGRVIFEAGKTDQWRAEIDELIYDGNELSGTLAAMPGDGVEVTVTGKRFDIGPIIDGDDIEGRERSAADDKATGPPLAIRAKIDEVLAGPDRTLTNVDFDAGYDGRYWRRLSLDADVGGSGKLHVGYGPNGDGFRLNAYSDDAGKTFKALDWSDKMEGGTLAVTGQRASIDGPLEGKFEIKGYKVSKAPLLARLLQVASLTGVFHALSQRGLDFVRFDGGFTYRDGYLEIAKSRAFGSDLGITLEGRLDLDDDIADLKGTVVPAYTVNQVLGQIPILGPLLTGGKDEGMFAATYALTGPLDDPEVTVNPLSALAPGFLRNLFDAIGGGTKDKGPTPRVTR